MVDILISATPGFLTTFSMLARDKISYSEMSWILVKVFFGSSYLGFDVALSVRRTVASDRSDPTLTAIYRYLHCSAIP